MSESIEEKERGHLELIGMHRSVLADAALEFYQTAGRGAFISYQNMGEFKLAYYTKDHSHELATEPTCSSYNAILDEMLNSYNPEQEFVVVIDEEVEDDTWDLSFYRYAFKPILYQVCSRHMVNYH